MVEIFRDMFSYFRGVDRRDLWILLWAPVAMTVFVALSQGGRHPVFESLFAGRFGADYLAASSYHWWKIVFFHGGVLAVFGLIPMAVVKFVFREKLSDYGFTVGDWRWGLKFLAVWCLIMGPGTYFNTFQADFLAEYPLCRCNLAGLGGPAVTLWFLIYLVYYVGWEFFFRGFMQIGLARRMGAFFAIMMQTIPSTIIHIGKPLGETASAIAGGLIFGAVALRTRSILWPLLAHWYIGCIMELFSSMHQTF